MDIEKIAKMLGQGVRVISKELSNPAITSKTASRTFSTQVVSYSRFPSRFNMGLNFLPAGHQYVIERFGKFTEVKDPGFALLIPFMHKIAYQVDTRELCLRIDPEIATTEDNVMVKLGGNLYVKFTDTEKAAYGASQPIYAVSQFAQSVMRTAVGDLKLDKLFSERGHLNVKVKDHMDDGTQKWGCNVIRFEITDLEPCDKAVSDSLHKQSTAERDRRETIITAQANKQKVELEADAYKYQQVTKAKGDAENVKLSADANAYQVEKLAAAQKKSIELIGSSLKTDEGEKVIKYLLSKDYIDQFGKIADKSNTMIIPQNMSNLSSMIGTGYSVFDKLNKS